ncbi:MAG: SDR family NAD(P)-dependent oxidoreductase [Chloroflexota bacterium]|nr:SDR family NAD(P)-dependent oxidoreductase [Chloroflexota bacterium]
MLESLRMDGKRVIVTGAGRGLGRQMALHLADAGADIVCAARTQSQIADVAAEIEARGRQALVIPTDVSDSSQVDAMVQQTIDEWGGFEVMLANAGASGPASMKHVTEISDDDWRETVDINFSSVFYSARAAVRHFLAEEKPGNIITVSSGTSLRGSGPAFFVDGAAKAGVINMTQSLAVQLARQQIRVNCIVPGFILQKTLEDQDEIELAHNQGSRIPIGRVGEAWELGPLAVYLASDASAYMTGEAFIIDGGGLAGGLAPTGWDVQSGIGGVPT